MEVGDLGAEQDDDEAERRRSDHQPVRRRAGRARRSRSALRTSPGPERDDHEDGQQHHGVGQVGDDDPRRERELHRDGAEQHLDHQQDQREHGGRPERAGSSRCRRQATTATASTRRLTSAATQRWPISIRVGRSSGGNHCAVAAGPVVAAAHAGAGDPDDPAEHDEAEGEARRRSRPAGGAVARRSGVGIGIICAGKERCRQPCQGYI